jgi:hypothetical protein
MVMHTKTVVANPKGKIVYSLTLYQLKRNDTIMLASSRDKEP